MNNIRMIINGLDQGYITSNEENKFLSISFNSSSLSPDQLIEVQNYFYSKYANDNTIYVNEEYYNTNF